MQRIVLVCQVAVRGSLADAFFARGPCAIRCCCCSSGGDANPGLLAGAGLAVLAAISSLGGGKGKKANQAAQKAKVGHTTIDVTTTSLQR